jgi:hypothetical protein
MSHLQAVPAPSGQRRRRQPAPPASTKPRTPTFSSVSEAVAKGSRRDVLCSSAARLAGLLDDAKCSARDFSPLLLRLLEVLTEIDACDAQAEAMAAGPAAADEAWNPDEL